MPATWHGHGREFCAEDTRSRPRPRSAASFSRPAAAAAHPAAPASSSSSGGSSSTNAATAASRVSAAGGMNALVTAAKKEGQLNVITLPADWANYGTIMKTSRQVRHQDQRRQPGRRQPGRDQRRQAAEGPEPRPGRARHGHGVRGDRPPSRACSPRTRWRPGTASRPTPRPVTAPGTPTTGATSPSATTPRRSLTPPTSFADLLKPEYKNKVAINGDPTKAGAAFAAVYAAALANGGSFDNIAAGRGLLQQAPPGRQLRPGHRRARRPWRAARRRS